MKTLKRVTLYFWMGCFSLLLTCLDISPNGIIATASAQDTLIIGPGPWYLISDTGTNDTSVVCDKALRAKLPIDIALALEATLMREGFAVVQTCSAGIITIFTEEGLRAIGIHRYRIVGGMIPVICGV